MTRQFVFIFTAVVFAAIGFREPPYMSGGLFLMSLICAMLTATLLAIYIGVAKVFDRNGLLFLLSAGVLAVGSTQGSAVALVRIILFGYEGGETVMWVNRILAGLHIAFMAGLMVASLHCIRKIENEIRTG